LLVFSGLFMMFFFVCCKWGDSCRVDALSFLFGQKTAYEVLRSLVGSGK